MECPICYCEMTSNEQVCTPCGHRFHRSCMTKWACTDEHKNDFAVPCPLCRTKLDMVSLLFGTSLFADVTDALFGNEPFYLAFSATS